MKVGLPSATTLTVPRFLWRPVPTGGPPGDAHQREGTSLLTELASVPMPIFQPIQPATVANRRWLVIRSRPCRVGEKWKPPMV
jgi:hypothetical protein